MEDAVNVRRRPRLGWFLILVGIIGVVSGIVPFTINALRILVDEQLWNMLDFAAHGVESLGLSMEWGLLSSAMGTYLGVLLLLAGTGWLKGRARALPATLAYVSCGLVVNVADMIIFAFRAKPGPVRTQMLVFDAIALLIPIGLGVWLLRRRGRNAEVPPPVGPGEASGGC